MFLQAYGQSRTGKTHIMQGSETDPGLLPRIVAELFALRQQYKLVMSISLIEVCGNTIRDLLDRTVLDAAQVDALHVRSTSIEQAPVSEVLAMYRVRTMHLLHAALKRRTTTSFAASAGSGATSPGTATAVTGKPHFIAIIRVERADEGKVTTLYVADLSGTVPLDPHNKSSFKAGIATNSNLVCTRRLPLPQSLPGMIHFGYSGRVRVCFPPPTAPLGADDSVAHQWAHGVCAVHELRPDAHPA